MSPRAKQDILVAVVIYAVVGFLFAVTTSLSSDSALLPRMVLTLTAIVNTVDVWYIIAKDKCTAKLILYTQGVEMGQDIIVLGT